MTFSDSELYNICNYLLDARKDRDKDSMAYSRPSRNDPDAPNLPAFDYLGAGRDRETWGYKDLAFKLQHPSPTSGGNPNRLEYENYERIVKMSMPANLRVPVTRLVEIGHDPVIVMQRIDAPTFEDMGDWENAIGMNWHDVYNAMSKIGLNDNADCNFAYDATAKTIYVLDLTT